MTILAWELSLLSHFFRHHLKEELLEASQSNQNLQKEVKNRKDDLNSILKTDEWVGAIANEVIDDIVMLVIREREERTAIVENTVSELISLFTDSKDQAHSIEDEHFIQDVTNELVDGIVSTLAQTPIEQTLPTAKITQDLQYALNACELVILAISKMIMVGAFRWLHCRKDSTWLRPPPPTTTSTCASFRHSRILK